MKNITLVLESFKRVSIVAQGDAAEESEESKSVNDDEKKKNLAAAKDTDSDSSSEQESSDDDEDAKNDSHDFEVQLEVSVNSLHFSC